MTIFKIYDIDEDRWLPIVFKTLADAKEYAHENNYIEDDIVEFAVD